MDPCNADDMFPLYQSLLALEQCMLLTIKTKLLRDIFGRHACISLIY